MLVRFFALTKNKEKQCYAMQVLNYFPMLRACLPVYYPFPLRAWSWFGGWGLWKAIQGIPHNQLKESVQWFLSVKRTKWTAGLTHRYYFSSLNLLYNLLTSKHSSLIFYLQKNLFLYSNCLIVKLRYSVGCLRGRECIRRNPSRPDYFSFVHFLVLYVHFIFWFIWTFNGNLSPRPPHCVWTSSQSPSVSVYILADKFPIIFVWNRIKFHVFIANHHRDWLFQNKAAPYRGVWTHPAALTTDSLLCIDVYL